jgi:nucleoside-diphosphate-sugar epimerase
MAHDTHTLKPTVLVTGGHGFIGAYVLRELRRRHCNIVVLDLAERSERWERLLGDGARDIRLVRGDLTDSGVVADTLDACGVSHIIHLVGLLTPDCQQNPVRGAEVNVLSTVRLLDLLRARRERIRGVSYASSYAVHGAGGDRPAHPETFYGAFKRSVELIAEQYWRHYGISTVGLRPYVVYGAGRETGISAAPSLAARAVALGQPYTIGFTGHVGLVFVEDAARAFVVCALEPPSGAQAIDMPGEDIAVAELIAMLARIRPGAAATLAAAGPALPPSREEHPCLLNRFYANWQDTPLEEGLRRTVEGWAALERGETIR